MEYDILIRDAHVVGHGDVVDIGIENGVITRVAADLAGNSQQEIDADGKLVSPGFVDCHMHIDKGFAACGHRQPVGHDGPFSYERFSQLEQAYNRQATTEDLTRNAIKNIQLAVAAGTTSLRTHVRVDSDARGLQNVKAVLEAEKQTRDIADVQLVIGAGGAGDESLLRDAIELALAEGGMSEPVLVGGYNPALAHQNIEEALERWFRIAADYDIDIDLHIEEGGTLGGYILQRLIDRMKAQGYEGRVTASHCFALAHLPDWWLEELVADFAATDLKVVTCYQSTRPTMPVRELLTTDGVTLGHGTDNDRDFVFPHGNADSLEGVLIESNKLHGDRTFVEDYRWFDSNGGLGKLWEMITENGAEILGIDADYGIEEGNPADLVVFDEPSPQWSIITQATRSAVIKRGNVVVNDGELVSKYRIVENYRDVLDAPLSESDFQEPTDSPSGEEP